MADEAQEVVAEVIEPTRAIVKMDVAGTPIAFAPAEIRVDWESIGAKLEDLMEPYAGMTADDASNMPEADLKSSRKDVNAIVKQMEDARKAVKRAYNEPLTEFETKVKELEVPAKEAAGLLKRAVDAKDEHRKAQKRQALIEHFEEFAPVLGAVVSYDQIAAKATTNWMNKTPSLPKCEEEEEGIIANVLADWEALKKQKDGMAYYAEAEAEFFRTLDLRAAMELNSRREEEQARLDEMKRQIDEAKAYQHGEPEPEPVQPAPEPEPEPQPEPQTVPENDQTAFAPQVMGNVIVTFTTDPMTQDEVAGMLDTLKSIGVHGTYTTRWA